MKNHIYLNIRVLFDIIGLACDCWTHLGPLFSHVKAWMSSVCMCVHQPIEALLPMFLGLTVSLDAFHFLLVVLPFAGCVLLGLLQAVSRGLTRSAVARRRFSILGISHRRSALSAPATETQTEGVRPRMNAHKLETQELVKYFYRWIILPACELWLAARGCSPGKRSSVSGQRWVLPPLSHCEHSAQAQNNIIICIFKLVEQKIFHFTSNSTSDKIKCAHL